MSGFEIVTYAMADIATGLRIGSDWQYQSARSGQWTYFTSGSINRDPRIEVGVLLRQGAVRRPKPPAPLTHDEMIEVARRRVTLADHAVVVPAGWAVTTDPLGCCYRICATLANGERAIIRIDFDEAFRRPMTRLERVAAGLEKDLDPQRPGRWDTLEQVFDSWVDEAQWICDQVQRKAAFDRSMTNTLMIQVQHPDEVDL